MLPNGLYQCSSCPAQVGTIYSVSGNRALCTSCYSAERQAIRERDRLSDRLFSGCFPTGIMYADRSVEDRRTRDYKRLGFLSYATLELSVEKDCPAELREMIERDAAIIQAKRGERFSVSASQFIILGE